MLKIDLSIVIFPTCQYKPYTCMAAFRGFDKILTHKCPYPWIRKDLRVKICDVESPGHCPYIVQVWDLN